MSGDGQSYIEPEKTPLKPIANRAEAPTPFTAFSEMFQDLVIKPSAIDPSAKPVQEHRKSDPIIQIFHSPEFTVKKTPSDQNSISARLECVSYDSYDTTTSSNRTPKRAREELFEDEASLREGVEHVLGVRHPRPTYPNNFKNSRSRSISDTSLCSQQFLSPTSGAPSLPCSPRGSYGSSNANTTADTSPFGGAFCAANRGSTASTASTEVLRFVSIATPSPEIGGSNPCSRNGSGTGNSMNPTSSRAPGRKFLAALSHYPQGGGSLSYIDGGSGGKRAGEELMQMLGYVREEEEEEGEGDEGDGNSCKNKCASTYQTLQGNNYTNNDHNNDHNSNILAEISSISASVAPSASAAAKVFRTVNDRTLMAVPVPVAPHPSPLESIEGFKSIQTISREDCAAAQERDEQQKQKQQQKQEEEEDNDIELELALAEAFSNHTEDQQAHLPAAQWVNLCAPESQLCPQSNPGNHHSNMAAKYDDDLHFSLEF